MTINALSTVQPRAALTLTCLATHAGATSVAPPAPPAPAASADAARAPQQNAEKRCDQVATTDRDHSGRDQTG